MTNEDKSLIDQYASFPRGAQELAAARLAQSVANTLERCLHASGKTSREIAGLLGLTEGAVSQVFNAEGNVRIATLGRYLRAMGYESRIEVTPADDSVPPVTPSRRRQRREAAPARELATPREKSVTVSVSRCNVTDGNVVAQALLLVLPHEGSDTANSGENAPVKQDPVWHILDAGRSGGFFREGWQTSDVSAKRGAQHPRSTSRTARDADAGAGFYR